ncbi:hypothetical protein NQZ68_022645 [Dissostichus eleginoides]|nr:hypothetical protein NQZ68_022645 [Dissostichus eleginoides]
MSLDLTYDLQCESGGNTLDPRPLLERPLLVRRVNIQEETVVLSEVEETVVLSEEEVCLLEDVRWRD